MKSNLRLQRTTMHEFALRIILTFPLLAISGGNLAYGQDGIVSSEKALERFPDAEWFDAENLEYVAPEIREFHDNPIRTEAQAVREVKTKTDWDFWPDWDFSWLPTLGEGLFQVLFYVFMTVIVIAIVALIVWFILREYAPNFRRIPKANGREVKIDPKRVVDLPFEAKPDMGSDPLAAVRRLLSSRDYDSAIIYLYGYMLLALDQHRHIYLQKGKTNRMYLRELKGAELKRILELAIVAFEDSFFGKHPLNEQRFMEVWACVDQFHTLVFRDATAAQTAPAIVGAQA